MFLSKKTADFCTVLLALLLLGIHTVDMSEQMYAGMSAYEFCDSRQKIYTDIVSSAFCAFVCLSFNCLSFTYNTVTKECRIHSGKCSSVGEAHVPDSIYYEVAVDAGDPGLYVRSTAKVIYGREKLRKKEKPVKTRCEDFSQTICSGVFQVHPGPGPSRLYYCYYAADNHLWNVIQYRYDGSEDFDRTWDEYKYGFGSLTHEFWLGNDEIHRLTAEKDTILRIEMGDFRNNKKYAQYNTFYIDDEQGKYKLTIGDHTGTAGFYVRSTAKFIYGRERPRKKEIPGDGFITLHNGMFFSTRDRDNDNHPRGSCAQVFTGGYWFNYCLSNNLNGKYGSNGKMQWRRFFPWSSSSTKVKVSRMMVRKK